LALLLKANPLVSDVCSSVHPADRKTEGIYIQLGLFDIVNTPGVAADLSHIATPAKVEGYLQPNDGLKKALTGADIVVIPAGVPRKPGVSL
jgi:malate dehydrogenase